MVIDLLIAFGITIAAMIVVGTIVKGFLGLRSLINWLAQTAALAGIVYVFSFTTPQTALMLALPAVIHVLNWVGNKVVEWRAARGDYGEEAQWAYELFEEQDQQFIHAQTALPQTEVMEVTVIADSKEELRTKMIERYNELASEDLNSANPNY